MVFCTSDMKPCGSTCTTCYKILELCFLPKEYICVFLMVVTVNINYVRFEVSTAVTMKNAVFWDMMLCRSCVNQRFGGTYHFHLQGRKIHKRGTSVSRWPQPLKRWFTQDLHDTTSQKTAFYKEIVYLNHISQLSFAAET
jgi:hypothetical protein